MPRTAADIPVAVLRWRPSTSTPSSTRRMNSLSTVTTAAPVSAPVMLLTPPMIAIVRTTTTSGIANDAGENAVSSIA